MISPRPSNEPLALALIKAGSDSLFGKFIDVATSTMTDLPAGKTYGLMKTQKMS